MQRRIVWALCISFFVFALIDSVSANRESFGEKFLGSPLLILVAIIIIDIIAFLYHKIRK